MRAPQYQIVAIRGLIETEEQYQVSGNRVMLLAPNISNGKGQAYRVIHKERTLVRKERGF